MSEVNRRDEAPTWIWESAGSGEILYGGMVSDLLSGVLQTHYRYYRRRLRAVILAKGDSKKYLIKGCQ